jgi:membrane protease YdiL (CAAX protease family)
MVRPPRLTRRPRSPGWYEDPWGLARRRWWDGDRWTSRVDGPLDMSEVRVLQSTTRSHRRRVRPRGKNAHAPAPVPAESAGGDTSGFASAALRPAFAAVMLGAPATFALLQVAQAQLPGRPVGEAAAFVPLWIAFVLATLFASRRYGSRRVAADTRLGGVRPVDALLALVVALAVSQLHELVVRGVAAVSPEALGPQAGFVTPPHVAHGAVVGITLLLWAGVGPVAEGLLLRGLLQPVLAARFRPAVAIGVQSVVSGLCHANPGLGGHTVSVVVAAAVSAAAFGTVAHLTRRLAPSIAGHALYEALVVFGVLRGA